MVRIDDIRYVILTNYVQLSDLLVLKSGLLKIVLNNKSKDFVQFA